jgi:transcriptional regulator with XRE-family HTH domain
MGKILTADRVILEDIGARLAQRRIMAGLSQAELARKAGIGRSTVERMEAGHSTQMFSFLRVLRVLGLLEQFVELIPEPGPSPMQLLKRKPAVRHRVSRGTARNENATGKWRWGDDA